MEQLREAIGLQDRYKYLLHEQLVDGAGFIKLAFQPEWIRVKFPVVEQEKVAPAFVVQRR